MSEELEPCPSGCSNISVALSAISGQLPAVYRIRCGCGWVIDRATKQEAIDAWNNRSTDERVVALRERLEAIYDDIEPEQRKTRDNYLEGRMDGLDNALVAIDELFPACKPSEEEVK